MHLANSVLFFLLELLIRWVFESFKLSYMFLNCTFILKPYLGELLRGSFNFAGYFFDISSLKGRLFYFNEYIFHSQCFWLVFFFTSACFYLRCSLNSYPVFITVMTSFTYSGLQTYLFYILLMLCYYLWFVCNTCCLTIGICGYLS